MNKTNGTVVEHPEYGEVLQLNGDQRQAIKDFLVRVRFQLKPNKFPFWAQEKSNWFFWQTIYKIFSRTLSSFLLFKEAFKIFLIDFDFVKLFKFQVGIVSDDRCKVHGFWSLWFFSVRVFLRIFFTFKHCQKLNFYL